MSNWLKSSEQQNNNIHFMLDPSIKTTPEDIERANEIVRKRDLHTAKLMEGDTSDIKSCDDVDIIPCNAVVIVEPYSKNPYRKSMKMTESGLYIPGFENSVTSKNTDSGENENNSRGICCCKVIAVGPKCENVRVGDDVFVNFLIANPFPFGGKGYYALSEMNIIASIRKHE